MNVISIITVIVNTIQKYWYYWYYSLFVIDSPAFVWVGDQNHSSILTSPSSRWWEKNVLKDQRNPVSVCLSSALSDSLFDLTDLSPLYCSPAGLWKRCCLSEPTTKHWLVLQRHRPDIQRLNVKQNRFACLTQVFGGTEVHHFALLSSASLFFLYDRLCVGSLAECSSLPGCSEAGQCSGDRSALGFRSLKTSGNVAGCDAVVQGVACGNVPHLCVHPASCAFEYFLQFGWNTKQRITVP